ncbi:hypothetical protein [Spiroplasma sp. BIUS-1]|uniref:hypothetical protein n=1 Tax=Spiroplasma sp. BIUS-1 TaxID=216964 RepID=UPI001397AD85|nr:hypothetical protein [Spiroplasma sp. BIUS-1]QHX36745.1 hypothetical protein SBIUS_v1c04920 [Spiroplasma sp. BIUS-1]
MKKLLTILGTLSISVPVTLSVSAFSINENQNYQNLETSLWSSSDYLKDLVKTGESFAVWSGKYEDIDFDYIMVADQKSVYVYLPNSEGKIEKKEIITGLEKPYRVVYNQILIYKNELYVSYFSQGNMLMYKSKTVLNEEFFKSSRDISKLEVQDEFQLTTSTPKSTYFDSENGYIIFSDGSTSSIYNFFSKKALHENVLSNFLDFDEQQRKIMSFGDDETNLLVLNSKKQIQILLKYLSLVIVVLQLI